MNDNILIALGRAFLNNTLEKEDLIRQLIAAQTELAKLKEPPKEG